MKNKGSYILFPVVILIWAIIGYRLVKYLSADKVEIREVKMKELQLQPQNFAPDTFSIVANYRDPFLGDEKKAAVIGAPKQAAPIKAVVKQSLPWPNISYHGIVKNNESHLAIAMVTIGKKLKNMSVSDEVDGVKVVDIERDSISVLFNGEKRTCFRNKKNEQGTKKRTP